MKYAEVIKAELCKMNVIDIPVTDEVKDIIKSHLHNLFANFLAVKVVFLFDPTLMNDNCRKGNFFVIPKRYYLSVVEWLKEEGFNVDIDASEICNIKQPQCVRINISLN